MWGAGACSSPRAAAPPTAWHTRASRQIRLSSGKLQDLGVVEGSKLTLVPTVEAGLMSQASRPEQSVMQALESLTETQSPAPSPAPAAPAPPMYCNAPHPAPVTAGMFRSHGASTQTVNSSVVSSCSEVDCGTRGSSSPGSSPAPTARSRKPGAVIESFVNHAPGVFSGTFSGT
ncbi:PREDICTED: midnolin [Nipponia nippon]|uniref:midnolin n=1 Tax=Nipponia nippon TaxID=128390 RepID=UPI0005119FEF|nr:PREDICTED: midnolin [Nipponia nippon]